MIARCKLQIEAAKNLKVQQREAKKAETAAKRKAAAEAKAAKKRKTD